MNLKTEQIAVTKLTPHPKNVRQGDVGAISMSLEMHGQYRPIVAQKSTGYILAGNHTYKAAMSLGWKDIAVTYVDVDDDQALRILLMDNRANDIATYDEHGLSEVLSLLMDTEKQLAGTGFSPEDLDELLALVTDLGTIEDPKPETTEAPDENKVPKVSFAGDVWLLGPHRLMVGDSRLFGDVEKLLDGKKINLAFTSPPYAQQRTYDESSGFKPIHPDEYVEWFADVAANVYANLEHDGSWFVNIKEHAEDNQRSLYVKDLVIAHVKKWSWKFVDELIWLKGGMPGTWPNRFKNFYEPVFHFSANKDIKFRPKNVAEESDATFFYSPETHVALTNDGYKEGEKRNFVKGKALPSNVIKVKAGGDGSHPAAFPVGLPQWFIKAYTDAGDTVYDPFMGSGSTLLAAHNEGRVAFGMEISPRYADIICARFQQLTGIKPIAEATGKEHDFLEIK
jgi:DNA modification methylase